MGTRRGVGTIMEVRVEDDGGKGERRHGRRGLTWKVEGGRGGHQEGGR